MDELAPPRDTAIGELDRRSLLQSSVILLGGEVSSRLLRPVPKLALAVADTLEQAQAAPAALDELKVVADYYSKTFDQHDFADLHATLTGYLKAALDLLRRPTTYRQRGELCLNGARIAGMLALLTAMQGKISESLSHYRNAYLLSEEIGDHGFMAWVMAERAAVAWSIGNAGVVRKLTESFVDDTTGAVRANMVSNLAQAELAAAAIPAEQNSDHDGTPIWGFSPSSTITNTAIAWLNLDEPQRALASARHSVELLGDHAIHRHVAHAKIIMATAHVGLGDPGEACRLAGEVIVSAPQDVFIVSRQSTDLLRALDRYRTTLEVRQLRELIAHYEQRLTTGTSGER